jgi:hypothetical protein
MVAAARFWWLLVRTKGVKWWGSGRGEKRRAHGPDWKRKEQGPTQNEHDNFQIIQIFANEFELI